MALFEAAHAWGGGGGGGGAKRPPSLKFITISYNETWHSHTLPKEDPKKYTNHVRYPLSFVDIRISSLEISKFCNLKKYKSGLHFDK